MPNKPRGGELTPLAPVWVHTRAEHDRKRSLFVPVAVSRQALGIAPVANHDEPTAVRPPRKPRVRQCPHGVQVFRAIVGELPNMQVVAAVGQAPLPSNKQAHMLTLWSKSHRRVHRQVVRACPLRECRFLLWRAASGGNKWNTGDVVRNAMSCQRVQPTRPRSVFVDAVVELGVCCPGVEKCAASRSLETLTPTLAAK